MAAFTDPTCKTPILDRSHHPVNKISTEGKVELVNKSIISSGKRSSVVVDQPIAMTEKLYHSSVMNDNYLLFSIGLCILSLVFGCFWTLVFSIPAIIYSVKARKAFKNTKYREMIENEKIAFGFNIGVIVCWIISLTIVIGVTYRELCGPTGIFCNTVIHR